MQFDRRMTSRTLRVSVLLLTFFSFHVQTICSKGVLFKQFVDSSYAVFSQFNSV